MRKWLLPSAAAVLVIAVMAFQAQTFEPRLTEERFSRLGEIAGYASEKGEPSEAELATLPKDTIIDRRHYRGDGGEYQVSLVIGGRSKSSLHRPELCLPSQGFQMSEPRTVEADGVDWRVVNLDRGGEVSSVLAYTFANQEGYRTSSHVRRIFRDVWDRSILNRIDRWAMVTVAAPRRSEAELVRFLSQLKGVLE